MPSRELQSLTKQVRVPYIFQSDGGMQTLIQSQLSSAYNRTLTFDFNALSSAVSSRARFNLIYKSLFFSDVRITLFCPHISAFATPHVHFWQLKFNRRSRKLVYRRRPAYSSLSVNMPKLVAELAQYCDTKFCVFALNRPAKFSNFQCGYEWVTASDTNSRFHAFESTLRYRSRL